MSLWVEVTAVCDKCEKEHKFKINLQDIRHRAELNWDSDLYHQPPLPDGWDSHNTYGAAVEVLCPECNQLFEHVSLDEEERELVVEALQLAADRKRAAGALAQSERLLKLAAYLSDEWSIG